MLAIAERELGGLDNVSSILKVTVFVSSGPDFTDQHFVADGASKIFVQALGERGEHSRSALGVCRLPMDSPVEVEAIVVAVQD